MQLTVMHISQKNRPPGTKGKCSFQQSGVQPGSREAEAGDVLVAGLRGHCGAPSSVGDPRPHTQTLRITVE